MPPRKSKLATSGGSGGQTTLSFGVSKPSTGSAGKENQPQNSGFATQSKKRGLDQISSTEKEESSTAAQIDNAKRPKNDTLSAAKQRSTDDCTNSTSNTPNKPVQQQEEQKKSTPTVAEEAAAKTIKRNWELLECESNLPLKPYSQLKCQSDPEFCPEKDSPQQKGQRMPFSFLVRALQLIEITEGKNSRTVIVEIMTNVFRSALVNFPAELSDILYFFIVKLAPDFCAMETGVGHEMSMKAIAKACGKSKKEIQQLYKEEGDLGDVVQRSKKNQGVISGFFGSAVQKDKKPLLFSYVFSEFRRIANTSGQSSATAKEGMIVKLVQQGTNDEAKYIIRFLQKTLKTGAAEKTVITALARAIIYTPPNKPGVLNTKKKLGEAEFKKRCEQMELAIKQAICEAPDYELVATQLMQFGDQHEKLKDHCKIKVGIPVKPMLAKPTKGVQIVLQRFEGIDFTCEYKYDGFRGQIHYDRTKADVGNDCHIYSRNLENMSVAYPDVLEIMRRLGRENPEIKNFIIDSELIAYDVQADKILPFQTLTQRSRKHVNQEDLKTKIAIQAFDLLYYNDKPLLQETFKVRRDFLYEKFKTIQGAFMFAKSADTNNFEDLEKFLDQSIKDCCEGLMVKTLTVNSTYEPSRRSFNWLKLKKDYLDTGLGDSVDLCVVGADYGCGKRTGWFSSFLLACWNEDLECFQTVCKCGTGFSDELFTKLKEQLEPLVVNKPANNLKIKEKYSQVKCDVYFEPRFVWEIKAADLSLSPMHTTRSGNIESDKGIALRFPRFQRLRDDKQPEDCTSAEQIYEMYTSQATVQVNFNDDDFDI